MLEVEAERRELINAEARTREYMTEEALEGETRRREEEEVRIGVVTEALERAAKEVKQREVKEALRRAEKGERLEVHWLAAEQQIKALDRMEAKHL